MRRNLSDLSSRILKIIFHLLPFSIAFSLTMTSSAYAGATQSPDLSKTLTNLINSYPNVSLKVSRVEEPTTNSYQYRLSYLGLTSSTSQCSLLFNNSLIQQDQCQWFGFGGSPLNKEGDYSLSIDGARVISFKFIKPKDNPAPLGKAVCIISKLKVSKASKTGTWLTIVDNGKCQLGNWSIGFQAGKENSGSGNAMPIKGQYFIAGLTDTIMTSNITPIIVTVYYTPKAHLAGTKMNLALR